MDWKELFKTLRMSLSSKATDHAKEIQPKGQFQDCCSVYHRLYSYNQVRNAFMEGFEQCLELVEKEHFSFHQPF